jgi:hypothetical protein
MNPYSVYPDSSVKGEPSQIIRKVLMYKTEEYIPPKGYKVVQFQILPKDNDYVYVLLEKIKQENTDNNKKDNIIA